MQKKELDELSTDPDTEESLQRKSVEDLLSGSGEVLENSLSQAISFANDTIQQSSPLLSSRRSPSPSPLTGSPLKHTSPVTTTTTATTTTSLTNINVLREQSKSDTYLSLSYIVDRNNDNTEDSLSKSSDSSKLASSDVSKSSSQDTERPKSVSKVSERAKKKSWYSALYPSYKSRTEDFKKLFKDVPDDERLVVDYSCAIQRDILVHGRLYVSQNYLCFYANIFRWETCLSIKWKDVTAITKEKTARVIPNAIVVCTDTERHFLTSFTTRDKAYLMLFRVWQNALMGKQMQPQEMWQWVHNCYGDELGLTSDDEDYIDPSEEKEGKIELLNKIPQTHLSTKSADSQSDDKSLNDSHSDAGNSSNLSLSEPKKIVIKKVDEIINLKQRQIRSNRSLLRDDSLLLPCDQLPTDMSDSSDSESNKNITFINQAECTSMHEGRQLVHTILPITVENLFSLLFSKSKFLNEFHVARKTTDMVHGDWQVDDDGKKTRQVNLTIALTQPVGPKSSQVTETQILRDCSQPGQLYSVDITSVNAGIPYADSFYVTMHYCLSRTVDEHTVFSVHAQVKYKKSVWGVVKGFIEKNTWAGLEDFYTALVRALQSEYCIPPAKAKARRPRRAANIQQRPIEEAPRAIISQVANIIRNNNNSNNNNDIIKEPIINRRKNKYEKMSWFVIILLSALLVLNVILYIKLWSLEQKTIERERFPNFAELKDPPKTHEDWLKILQQQEALHATEMIKWQKVLQTAIELLRKTEKTLTDLQFIIKIHKFKSNNKNINIENNENVNDDDGDDDENDVDVNIEYNSNNIFNSNSHLEF